MKKGTKKTRNGKKGRKKGDKAYGYTKAKFVYCGAQFYVGDERAIRSVLRAP